MRFAGIANRAGVHLLVGVVEAELFYVDEVLHAWDACDVDFTDQAIAGRAGLARPVRRKREAAAGCCHGAAALPFACQILKTLALWNCRCLHLISSWVTSYPASAPGSASLR